MAAFPSFPIFIDDYLGDTMHLTSEEHGVYLRLLMYAWKNDDAGIPDDDKWICNVLRIHGNRWNKIKPTILKFWIKVNGRLYQERLKKEREYVEEKSKKSRSAARQRWSSFTSNSMNNNDTTNADAKQTLCDGYAPTPTPKPTPIKLATEKTIFKEEEIKKATLGQPAYDPAFIEGEILPGGWFDEAEKFGIPENKIYPSWTNFKRDVQLPYARERWVAWCKKDKYARAELADAAE